MLKYIYNMTENNSQQQFDNIINKYLENSTNLNGANPEFEIRFGTLNEPDIKNNKDISKIKFDNVIQKLKSSGFELLNVNNYTLKIQSEFLNKKTGKIKESNVRIEIEGLHSIQQYCKTNSLQNIPAVFTQKDRAFINDSPVWPIDIYDYNLRASFQTEKPLSLHSPLVQSIISSWDNSKKTFRYLNRTSFIHSNYPIRIDLSVVKESNSKIVEYEVKGRKKKKIVLIPEYIIQTSQVFENEEKYNIEIEILNNQVGIGTKFNTGTALSKVMRKSIICILSGLQNTNYPVSYNEIRNIGEQYLYLIHGKDYNYKQWLKPKMFLGPSSTTLQIKNIAPINDDAIIPNIRNNYTVTEKADGLRKLLYINKEGKIYLIDTNMNIQFTGAITKNVDLFETILDGEHILHNKKGEFINLYAAFDVYIVNKKNVRANAFIPSLEESANISTKYRLPVLVSIIENLGAISSFNDKPSPIRIEYKKFKAANNDISIFQQCNAIIDQEKQGLFEYEIDGLIFTPGYYGVGTDKPDAAGPLYKTTWQHSFKWKPPQYNTIDFLVSTKKDTTGTNDVISTIFQNGINVNSYEQLSQYKTLILRVGFDEQQHGYINPCADVINDNISHNDKDKKSQYHPLPFYPTNPSDDNASVCNVMLSSDENGNKNLMTTENEVFGDDTIVEFSYDFTREEKWRWVPLRVRYDKTEEYKKKMPMYGNDYRVANNNWHSLHNPITESMIRTGDNIPDLVRDDDVYYNRISNTSETDALCDFHNKFVKRFLVNSISTRGNTLIDYAVGQGGDIPKWIKAKLSFVFGIDLSPDNIENRLKGACARYLNFRKDFKVMPYCLFAIGNSSENIKNGQAFENDKTKMISKAIFGEGPKDKDKLGMGVYRQYGKASEGFNISSCQFALHYFFENKRTLNGFLRNICECTKLGGYFIGGCYNGASIFEALKDKEPGESISILENKKKIWQITKEYKQTAFNNDETSLNYKINVFQETINKPFPEYLVNFDYLHRMMENYGFTTLSREECNEIGVPSSVGSFQQLYGLMEQEINKNPKKKNDYGNAQKMSFKDKQISFYNNYFIYKKVRNIDINAVYNTMVGSSKFQEQMENLDEEKAQKAASEEEEEYNETKKIPKKLKQKLKL